MLKFIFSMCSPCAYFQVTIEIKWRMTKKLKQRLEQQLKEQDRQNGKERPKGKNIHMMVGWLPTLVGFATT